MSRIERNSSDVSEVSQKSEEGKSQLDDLVEKAYSKFFTPPESMAGSIYDAWDAGDDVIAEVIEGTKVNPVDLAFDLIKHTKKEPWELMVFSEAVDIHTDDWQTFFKAVAGAVIQAELRSRFPEVEEEEDRRYTGEGQSSDA